MNLFIRVLICGLVTMLAVCTTAAIQIYSGGPYSNTLALVMGAAAFFVAWLTTKKNGYDGASWFTWWW